MESLGIQFGSMSLPRRALGYALGEGLVLRSHFEHLSAKFGDLVEVVEGNFDVILVTSWTPGDPKTCYKNRSLFLGKYSPLS